MDIERDLRNELRQHLSSEFDTFEEVSLTSTNGHRIRADVIASPRSSNFSNTLFAFEVKTASNRNFQKWTHVFKQAYDYVQGTVEKSEWENHTVTAAFVFPAPPYNTAGGLLEKSDYWRLHEAGQIAGVMHMASMFNVGAATLRNNNPRKGLNLSFGPNTLWNEFHGWFEDGKRLLSSQRIGSRTQRVRT